MNWEDEGYLLSKRKFRENAIIISAFTKKYGKITGIVYGGTSRKVKNYLQIGNKIFIIHNSKNRNKLGYLKTEIIEAISPRYFNDKKRSYVLLSITELLNSLLPDEESHKNIYLSLNDLIENLDNKSWPIIYSFWEVNLIKELGFGFKTDKTKSSEEILSINIDNIMYKVPKFIINQEIPTHYTGKTVNQALSFTRNLLLNKFFLPNNLFLPRSRVIFENCFS
tara:strand:- start:4973 stop:5641 length:669 start_codon:yes stop_codon:yes gene_type:complete